MKESQFGFEYTWADLQPIRHLAITVFGAQIAGVVLGFWFGNNPEWFLNIWFGGAVATFPAYLIGVALQTRLRPGSITENIVMVRRFGLIALVLTVFAFAMPILGFK